MTERNGEADELGALPNELRVLTHEDIPADMEKAEIVPTKRSVVEFPPSIWGQSKLELWMFVLIIGSSGQISTLSIPSFFPTIPILAKYFDTTVENINLTATIYSIFQGIAPLIWATLSDSYGRRPVYFLCIATAIVANFVLANINTYGALFGLRILQAIGAAPTVSLVSAVVGDITQRKNRGGVSALLTGFQSIGNCFGPLIGGAIMHTWSWRAVFYFLACHAALLWLLMIVFIPETNRHFSGNGSVMPRNWVYRSPYALNRHKVKGVPYMPSDPEYSEQWMPPPHKVNFLRWIYLLRQVDVILVLVPNSVTYTTWYMVLTSMSTYLTNTLHFSSLKVGYCYLASGVGALGATLIAGRAMNWNYKRRLREAEASDHKKELNIFQARLELTFWATIVLVATTVVYGWTLHYNIHYIVPIVMTFFISFGATFFLNTSTVILVDLFPDDSAASTSCVNLTRCLLCAAGLAAVDKMESNMTIGGTFTFLGGLCGLAWICIFYEMRFGDNIARKRRRMEREHMVG